MFCQTCKTKLDEGETECRICGRSALVGNGVNISGPEINTIFLISKYLVPKPIKCESCGYKGQGEFVRKMTTQIFALLSIFFFPFFPIFYFGFTYKYRCPDCKSNSLTVKNNDGKFESQVLKKRKVQKVIFIFLAVLVGLILLFALKAKG